MPPGLKQAARAERGGACREGRGLLLGLAQEMGRGAGPIGCLFGQLVYSWRGSFNPEAGGREGKRGLDLRTAGTEVGRRRVEGGGCSGDAKAAAFLEESR